jgi:hypothetical protein
MPHLKFTNGFKNMSCFLFLLVSLAVSVPALAQTSTETVLGTGVWSLSKMIQAADGNFYGIEEPGSGQVFRLGAPGSLQTITANGQQGPSGQLIEAGDGNLYGVSQYGFFKVALNGTVTQLNSVAYDYSGGLTLGADGNFYGIAYLNFPTSDAGSIFQVSPEGVSTTIYTFCADTQTCPEGSDPIGLLTQGLDGNFYGVGVARGPCYGSGSTAPGCGVIFWVSLSGEYHFGAGPVRNVTDTFADTVNRQSLVESPTGDFYGTFYPVIDYVNAQTFIFNFDPSNDSETFPFVGDFGEIGIDGGLFLASDGNYYGASSEGEECSNGTCVDAGFVYEAMPAGAGTAGSGTAIYQFCSLPNCADGESPDTGLIQGSDGSLYGAAANLAYKVSLIPALPAPVQLSIAESDIPISGPGTLTWQALNTFSLTMQQCYLFQNLNGTLTPLGQLTGTLSNNIFGGTTTVTPSEAGVYTYAVTCGGVESGFATVRVGGAKVPTATSFTATTPVTLGQTATLTATPTTTQSVGELTGSVAFSSGGTSLGSFALSNGSAVLNVPVTNLAAGTYPVTATYSGDTNYLSSTATTSVTVQGYATSATLTTSATTLTQGQSETLTAKVARTSVSGTPTGNVLFYAGTDLLATVALKNSTATYTAATNGTIPPGTYAVTAKYTGDSSDQAATTTATDITVLAATATSLAITPSSPIPADHAVTLTVTIKQSYGSGVPTGTVKFTSGSYQLGTGTLTNGTVSLNTTDTGFPAGTYPITAAYSGDASNAASSATVNVVVQ